MPDVFMNIVIGILLLICGVQDMIKRKFNIIIIMIGALLAMICIPFCNTVSLHERFYGLGIGLCVLLISKVTEGKIGLGDGFILCVTGLGLGFWRNLEIFGIALFFAAVTSIILLTTRLADCKKSIPFVPFIMIAYIFVIAAANGSGA